MSRTLFTAPPAHALLLAAGLAAGESPPTPPEPPEPPEPPHAAVFQGGDDDFFVSFRPARSLLGVRLTQLTPELREHFGAPKDAGVLVAGVEAGSPAAEAGLQVGDVLTKVAGTSVASAGDVRRALRGKKAGEKADLDVLRDRAPRSLAATLKEPMPRRRQVHVGSWEPHEFNWHYRVPSSEEIERALERVREKLREVEKRLNDLDQRLRSK